MTPLPKGTTETTTCIEYCSQVEGSVLVIASRRASSPICAGQEVLTKLTDVIILADVIEGFKTATAWRCCYPPSSRSRPLLSIVLGIVKAGMVHASLPWVRLPSFQIVVSTSILLPCRVHHGGHLPSRGRSVLARVQHIVSSALSHSRRGGTSRPSRTRTPSRRSASGPPAALPDRRHRIRRGVITTSERLREVLLESNFVDLRNVLSVDQPNTAIWTLVQVMLDFLGKSVLSNSSTDLLLRRCQPGSPSRPHTSV